MCWINTEKYELLHNNDSEMCGVNVYMECVVNTQPHIKSCLFAYIKAMRIRDVISS